MSRAFSNPADVDAAEPDPQSDPSPCDPPLPPEFDLPAQQLASHLLELESRSTLFEKLPTDLRRQVDQAIIDHDPPSYRAMYAKFDLASHGVSLGAFHRYGRRLRIQADLLHVAHLALPDSPDVAQSLPTLLAYRLLDALNTEESSPRLLHRLTDAWRIATNTKLSLDRQEAALAEIRRKSKHQEADELCKSIHQLALFRRADNAAQQSAIPPEMQSTSSPEAE